RRLGALNDEPVGRPEIDRRAVHDRAGGMAGVGDADRKISAGDFADGVARIYFLGALPFQSHA
ncbi:MAG: hypothetical protein WBQ53_08165, partial [Methylocystis sp.]